jgi:hypothetical protein
MNTEILKKINAEWLLEKTLPSLVRRDAPEIALEQSSDIIAVAGPGKSRSWKSSISCDITFFITAILSLF